MALKLSHESFCSLLAQSGLIDDERLTKLLDQFLDRLEGKRPDNCQAFAEFLIRQNKLTFWQAKKLLQGKHKGFFLGKYRLLSLLGRGGMSSVYLAEHTVMRRRCAIKVLPFKQVENKASLGRFHREARAVASLDHPNIVRAYDVDHMMEGSTEIHFLVMEYVEGRSLQQLVDENGPVEFADAVEYVRQAASGLAHAHAVGMVHRDVKPSNLLLDETGTVKVLDLGLARIIENATETSSLTIEHDQTVLGTADYLSPEQAVDSHTVDHRSDIYSLGCTLFFLLTGGPPFPDGALAQRLLAHQVKKPPPVSEFRPDVPASLEAIVKTMMAKQPEQRMASAEVAEKTLADWLHDNADQFPLSTIPSPPKTKQTLVKPEKAKRPTDPTAVGFKSPDAPSNDSGPMSPPQESTPEADASDSAIGDFRDFLSNLDSPSEKETTVPALSVSETVVTRKKPRILDGAKRDSFVVGSQTETTKDAPVGDSTVTHVGLQDVQAVESDPVPPLGATKSTRFSNTQILSAGVGSAVLMAVAGWFLLSGPDDRTPSDTASSGVASNPVASNPVATITDPKIEPGTDITVGPKGHFDSITAAIEYVTENFRPLSSDDVRTIRVAGGHTYHERIVIDNSQFGGFPQGVRLVCDDIEPAVLQPEGSDPIVDLRTVERFVLKRFHLRGTGQPTLVRLEGYLVSTTLADLMIEGSDEFALQGAGVSGFSGDDRFRLENLTILNTGSGGTALRFEPGQTPTKDMLLTGCRLIGEFDTGLAVSGGASHVEVERCIFDGSRTSVRLTDPPELIEDIALSNCTMRSFQQGISLQRRLTGDDGRLTFNRNLFLSGTGAEFAAQDAPPPDVLQSSLNWSDRAAPTTPTAGEVDIFQEGGRRGATIPVVGTDASARETYLQPSSAELREAGSQTSGPHAFIGAVPPAAE